MTLTRLGAWALASLLWLSPHSGTAARAETAEGSITARADEAYGRDDYVAAETLYRSAVDAGEGGTHALSRLAQLLSWKGDYAEAIALYERALAIEPGGFETRRGLAQTRTWSENYPQALKLYDALLAERPGDERVSFEMAQALAWSGDFEGAAGRLQPILDRNPGHVKARVLMGQVRLWSGDAAAAEPHFGAALAQDPDNADALSGMGAVRSSQGRQDEALALYDRALSVNPKNRAAMEGRAEALAQQGHTSEALAAVRETLEIYPTAAQANRLGQSLGGPLRPSLYLWGSTLQDSDDNDVGQWGGTYTHHLGGQGYVGARFAHAQSEATSDLDTPVARYDTLRILGGYHVSPKLHLYGELGAERNDFPLTDLSGDHGNPTRTHPAGELALEANPAPWATVVGSVSQEALVATSQAFMNDVRVRAFTVSGIFRPHPSLRLRATGQVADFLDEEDWDVDAGFVTIPETPDDNSRDLVSASASWTTSLKRPKLILNYNLRWMSYETDLDQGYFDPDHYVSHLVGFDLSDALGRSFYWGLGADTGVQVIDGFSTTNQADVHDIAYAYRLLAGINLGESASVEAYYWRTDLAAQNAAGFRSTEAGLRFNMRFGPVLGPASPGPGARPSRSPS